ADPAAITALAELTRTAELAAFVVFLPLPPELAALTAGSGAGEAPDALTGVEEIIADRIADGRPATAIAWGPWQEDMTAAGVGAVDPGVAMSVLEEAPGNDGSLLVVADIDWPKVVAAHGPLPEFFRDIADLPEQEDAGPAGAGRLAERLAAMAGGEAQETL